MKAAILTIIMAVASMDAAVWAGAGDDWLSTGLAKDLLFYEGNARLQELKDVGLDVAEFPAMVDSLRARGAASGSETVALTDSEGMLMRFLLAVTDMSQTGIKLSRQDFNITDEPMTRAVVLEQEDMPDEAVRTDRLPYIAAWMKENHRYLSQEMADSYLACFRAMTDIFTAQRDRSVSDDLMIGYPDFHTDEAAAVYSDYESLYEKLTNLRAKFVTLKYGDE